MNNFKRILVTGGYGFIGSAVIRKLLKTTNSEVYNLDKLSSVSDNQSILDLINSNHISEYIQNIPINSQQMFIRILNFEILLTTILYIL